jgi:hypothetical protein
MKKLTSLLLCLLALCAFACSANSSLGANGGEAGDSGAETLGSTQQALNSCPFPINAHGTQYYPPVGYITGVHVGSVPSKLALEFTYVANGSKDYAEIDYGANHITFAGGGWSGSLTNRYLSTTMYTPGVNCVPGNSDLYCWHINGTLALTMNQQQSVQLSSSGYWTQYHGVGLTKFTGRGLTDPQKLRVWWDTGSAMYSTDWTVLGPAMTACL